ncbi:MAG TPA: sulfurtransferase [Steroidobacter sp.]|nr:sulfurtransferase [Steroidobacter sp.]
MHTTLIAPSSDLVRRASEPGWLFVDCRFDLANPSAGEAAWRAGHIPGAVYAHAERDLSAPVTATSGRHPLPDPEVFAQTLGSWGLTSDTQVVAYDADNGVFASRLWWLLRWVGHRAVAVLNGGYKAWLAAGLPTSTQAAPRSPVQFIAKPDREAWVDSSQVAACLHHSNWLIIDARAPERFAGEVEPLDAVAGHIPGARNYPYTRNIGPGGRFVSADQIAAQLDVVQRGVANDHTIVMCGSGVTACHLLLAMEIAGRPGAKLYAGSWSEWIKDPARPVEVGRSD